MESTLELPLFDLSNMKRAYHRFLIAVLLIAGCTLLIKYYLHIPIPPSLVNNKTIWLMLVVLFVPSSLFGIQTKKQLKAIVELDDFELKTARYENLYKKRLIWNGLSVLITACLYVLLKNQMFIYVLLGQTVLSVMFSPSKKFISKELQRDDIVFG